MREFAISAAMELNSPVESCALAASAAIHQLLPDEQRQLTQFDDEEKFIIGSEILSTRGRHFPTLQDLDAVY